MDGILKAIGEGVVIGHIIVILYYIPSWIRMVIRWLQHSS